MARFKTVLEHAIALRRSGRALWWAELALVKAVLGDGSGQVSGQGPASGQGMKQVAGKPVYVRGLKIASADVQYKQRLLRENALVTGQRKGEWRDWGFGDFLHKKSCNKRRKQA